MHNHDKLDRHLIDRIIDRLGLVARPEPTCDGLARLYASWCRRLPFDNVQKRVYLAGEAKGALPGDDPDHFFRDWLEEGTGGTCWAGNGALASLLINLGFAARRALATVHADETSDINHGTVIVEVEGEEYCVDTAMLFSEPLLLDVDRATKVDSPVYGVTASGGGDGRFVIEWRPFYHTRTLEVSIEEGGVSAEEFSRRHELTRLSSRFNSGLTYRILRGEGALGVWEGKKIEVAADGTKSVEELPEEEWIDFLTEEGGISLECAARLPIGSHSGRAE